LLPNEIQECIKSRVEPALSSYETFELVFEELNDAFQFARYIHERKAELLRESRRMLTFLILQGNRVVDGFNYWHCEDLRNGQCAVVLDNPAVVNSPSYIPSRMN